MIHWFQLWTGSKWFWSAWYSRRFEWWEQEIRRIVPANVASVFLLSFFWSTYHKEREHGAVVLCQSHAFIRSYCHGCLGSFTSESASSKNWKTSSRKIQLNSIVIEELSEKEEMKRSWIYENRYVKLSKLLQASAIAPSPQNAQPESASRSGAAGFDGAMVTWTV